MQKYICMKSNFNKIKKRYCELFTGRSSWARAVCRSRPPFWEDLSPVKLGGRGRFYIDILISCDPKGRRARWQVTGERYETDWVPSHTSHRKYNLLAVFFFESGLYPQNWTLSLGEFWWLFQRSSSTQEWTEKVMNLGGGKSSGEDMAREYA